MKKLLLTKSLLALLMLFVGTNVWADETLLSKDFTAIGESTDPADYGFTITYGSGSSSTLVNFTVTDGVLKCDAGPYASLNAGNRTGTATATFTETGVRNEISLSLTWLVGSATGNATGSYSKISIGNASGKALELGFFGSEGKGVVKLNGNNIINPDNTDIRNTTYTVSAKLNMNTQKITELKLTNSANSDYNYTATEAIDFMSSISTVDRFAFENSERQNWTNTSNIDNLVITSAEAIESVKSIVVNYTYNNEVIYTDNIATTGLYVGDSYTVPFRMFVEKEGALYNTVKNNTNPYYGDATTLTLNTVVTKTLSSVDLNGGELVLLEDLDDTNGENAGIRASYCSAYNNKSYTSAVELTPGIYTFIVKALNKGRGSSIAVGTTTVCGIDEIVAKNSWGDKTFTDVTISEAGNVTLVKGGGNTIDAYDIIIAIKTGELPATSVTATIGEAGWATLFTDKALDFTGTDVKAYTVTSVDNNTVVLQPFDQIPAYCGVVLQGAEGSYDIPILANGSVNDAGLLKGSATEATAYNAYDGYTIYILAKVNNGKDVQFVPCTSGEIAAGKAFLSVANGNLGTAKAMQVVFASEATGISNVNVSVPVPVKRIQNGQLIIEKNGKAYNAAGQLK